MIKSVKEFEALVVDVLKTISHDAGLSELESSHKTEDIFEALNFCIENKFIIGFSSIRQLLVALLLIKGSMFLLLTMA